MLGFELHPGSDLFDGATFEMFLEHTEGHSAACVNYDPSHLLLQQLDYLNFIELYGDRIAGFHVREDYASRSLELSFEETRKLRQEIIYQSTVNYAPDFLFVDTVPCGLRGEMLKTLRYIRKSLPGTRVFLVLRDILDDPSLLIPAWKELGAFQALEEHYDRIFVCGHHWLYDPVKEYGFPASVRSRVEFCGYLKRGFDEEVSKSVREELASDGQKLVVVTVGGGADGEQLVGSFLQSLEKVRRKVPVNAVLLLGPEMAPGPVAVCFGASRPRDAGSGFLGGLQCLHGGGRPDRIDGGI